MIIRSFSDTKYKAFKKLAKIIIARYKLTYNELSNALDIPVGSINAFLMGNNNSAEILLSLLILFTHELELEFAIDYKKIEFVGECKIYFNEV